LSNPNLNEKRELEGFHAKPLLTTRFGRFIDRATYLDLVLFCFLYLAAASLFFYLSPGGSELAHSTEEDISYGDALYFTIVTFSSLGYGDYSPTGWNRLVAGVTVFSGLSFFAILIGKVASERTQSTLNLLHRSDIQRRLVDLTFEARTHSAVLCQSLDEEDVQRLKGETKETYHYLAKAANFLTFNLNQTTALAYGNESGVSGLLAANAELQETLFSVHEFSNQQHDGVTAERCHRLVCRMPNVFSLICEHKAKHDPASPYLSFVSGWWRKPKSLHDRVPKNWLKHVRRMERRVKYLENWRDQNIIVDLAEKIADAVPPGPRFEWDRDEHKVIAKMLGISSSKAAKYIAALFAEGTLPK
jgi:hypothetical protein